MSEIQPGETHLEILEQGVDAWNRWRIENPAVKPQLAGADLSDLDLSGVNLGEADLSGAECFNTDFSKANLKMSVLRGGDFAGARFTEAELYKADLSQAFFTGVDFSQAYLAEVDMHEADLRGSSLNQSNLNEADLTGANLSEADLSGAVLTGANITDTNFCFANFDAANLIGMRYGSYHSMMGHYHGVRGLDSCFGNALFVRDAQDQDYLDTLKHNIDHTVDPRARKFRRFWFRAWSLIDYGRSLAKPAVYALVLAGVFGTIYWLDMVLGWGLMDYSGTAESWLTPFYYSIVTYTTLGFGDITPKHWLGEVIVVIEVILGYTTLGLLLSILANMVARRS